MSSRNLKAYYSGSRRKIVLAFDVGTTYSGISYRQDLLFIHWPVVLMNFQHSILDPGQSPGINIVTRYIFLSSMLVE